MGARVDSSGGEGVRVRGLCGSEAEFVRVVDGAGPAAPERNRQRSARELAPESRCSRVIAHETNSDYSDSCMRWGPPSQIKRLCPAPCQIEMRALDELIGTKLPRLQQHFQAIDFDISMLATDWYLCLFSVSLPSEVRLVPGSIGRWLHVLVNVCSLRHREE